MVKTTPVTIQLEIQYYKESIQQSSDFKAIQALEYMHVFGL